MRCTRATQSLNRTYKKSCTRISNSLSPEITFVWTGDFYRYAQLNPYRSQREFQNILERKLLWAVATCLKIKLLNMELRMMLLVLMEFIDEAFLKFTVDSMNYNISMKNNNSMDCNISRWWSLLVCNFICLSTINKEFLSRFIDFVCFLRKKKNPSCVALNRQYQVGWNNQNFMQNTHLFCVLLQVLKVLLIRIKVIRYSYHFFYFLLFYISFCTS